MLSVLSRTLFRGLSWLPLAVLQYLGGCAGAVTWRCARAVRDRAIENAQRAGFDWAIACRSVREAGKGMAELPFLWRRGAAAIARVQCDDWHVVETIWQRG